MLAKSAQIKERAYVRALSPSRQPQFLSYESLMAKIVATFICLYFTLIGRTDVRAAGKREGGHRPCGDEFPRRAAVGCAGSGFL
jgi:hypothetical protein